MWHKLWESLYYKAYHPVSLTNVMERLRKSRLSYSGGISRFFPRQKMPPQNPPSSICKGSRWTSTLGTKAKWLSVFDSQSLLNAFLLLSKDLSYLFRGQDRTRKRRTQEIHSWCITLKQILVKGKHSQMRSFLLTKIHRPPQPTSPEMINSKYSAFTDMHF